MIIFCDIDGTISDSAWRDPMLKNNSSWDEYYLAGDDDKPIVPISDMIKVLNQAGATIIGTTGRPEKWRALTMKWLLRYNIPFDELLMRAETDRRPSPQVKIDFLKVYTPDLVIDDRADICAAFCSVGISTLLSTYCGVR
jgi:hypothetical protein